MPDRVYLDWNATAPLRPEARAAMIEAMDVVGNPSSVHAEGRAAKMIVEKAREQVAALVSCDTEEVVFTSGATEAAALAAHGRTLACTDLEHDAVTAHRKVQLDVGTEGEPMLDVAADFDLLAVQSSNSETGLLQNNIAWSRHHCANIDPRRRTGKTTAFGDRECRGDCWFRRSSGGGGTRQKGRRD